MLDIFAADMNIYEKIRILRQSKGFTQEYVADKLNIDPVNYGRIERGQTKLTVERLYKIAKIFDVKVTDFFDEIYSETDNSQKENFTDLLRKIYETEVKILNILENKN